MGTKSTTQLHCVINPYFYQNKKDVCKQISLDPLQNH